MVTKTKVFCFILVWLLLQSVGGPNYINHAVHTGETVSSISRLLTGNGRNWGRGAIRVFRTSPDTGRILGEVRNKNDLEAKNHLEPGWIVEIDYSLIWPHLLRKWLPGVVILTLLVTLLVVWLKRMWHKYRIREYCRGWIHRSKYAPLKQRMQGYARSVVLPQFHLHFRHVPLENVKWRVRCYPACGYFTFWLQDPGRYFSERCNSRDIEYKLAQIAERNPAQAFQADNYGYRRGWVVVTFQFVGNLEVMS